MNTHKYTATLLFLFCFLGHLLSQKVTAQLNGQSRFRTAVSHTTPASTTYSSNKSYSVDNPGLNARQFGQTRTVSARLRVIDQQRKATQAILKAREVIDISKQKIQLSKERLANDIKNGELPEAELQKRADNILIAEKKLRELEKSIQRILNMEKEKSM